MRAAAVRAAPESCCVTARSSGRVVASSQHGSFRRGLLLSTRSKKKGVIRPRDPYRERGCARASSRIPLPHPSACPSELCPEVSLRELTDGHPCLHFNHTPGIHTPLRSRSDSRDTTWWTCQLFRCPRCRSLRRTDAPSSVVSTRWLLPRPSRHRGEVQGRGGPSSLRPLQQRRQRPLEGPHC